MKDTLNGIVGLLAIILSCVLYLEYDVSLFHSILIFLAVCALSVGIIELLAKIYDKYEQQRKIRELRKYINKLNLHEKVLLSLVNQDSQASNITQGYNDVLQNDLMKFYCNAGIFDEFAKDKLEKIAKQLIAFNTFPELFNKRIFAIGGSFSAGKSKFLMSLVKDNRLSLPEGINPTTAIPTYVIHDERSALYGMGTQGGMINLTEIDPEINRQINHEFLQGFGFNLKNIMPYMIMTGKTDYEHICFIDTPGYNPSSSQISYIEEDRDEAHKFIQKSDVLIWLVPVTAGTIPDSDLEFLEEVMEENRPLYIVVNKSDQRPIDDLKQVLAEIQKTLESYDIEYVGISAYSSQRRKEYLFEKESLFDFLNKYNVISQNDAYSSLEDAKKSLVKKLKEKQEEHQKLKDELIELRSVLASDWRNSHEDLADKLLEHFGNVNYTDELDSIMSKFKAQIDLFYQDRK